MVTDPLQALEHLRAAYRDRHAPAREWRAAGRRVAGYFCDNLPEELLIAAQILPVRISGDPMAGREHVERYLEPQEFGSRLGFDYVASMLEEILAGRYDYLDYLIVPHTRKSIESVYRRLCRTRQLHPELPIPELHFLDRTYTHGYRSALFNRAQVTKLRNAVEHWIGHSLEAAEIAQAISLTNEARRLLREISALRSADPPWLSGVDALHVIGASMVLPKSRFVSLARTLIDGHTTQLTPRRGVRVFVGGSPFDHPALYEVIEELGGIVVAEDHCWGARCGDFAVDDQLDPIEALAARYHAKPACSIALPLSCTVQLSVERACSARAEIAVFVVQRGDELQIWETPEEIHALAQHGVPSLHLSNQSYRLTDRKELAARIAPFIGAQTKVRAE